MYPRSFDKSAIRVWDIAGTESVMEKTMYMIEEVACKEDWITTNKAVQTAQNGAQAQKSRLMRAWENERLARALEVSFQRAL